MIIEINDINLPELDIFARLSENELRHYYEPNGGLFIAESPNVIERALNAGCIPVSMLIDKADVGNSETKRIIDIVETKDKTEKNIDTGVGVAKQEDIGTINIYAADKTVLKALTGFPMTRGMLCAFSRPMPKTVEEICAKASRIAVLEDVMNPTNIGAIFRSAAALGTDAVLLTKGCSDPYYRRAARVSMGTVFQIPWTYFEHNKTGNGSIQSDGNYIKTLRDMGFFTVAMALRNDTLNINDKLLKDKERIAIILGSEGPGLKEETINACDATVKIPMMHGVDSLNVAAASAVAFWELRK